MARSKLLWYRTLAKAIMYDINELPLKDIANEINESVQTAGYRRKNVYPKEIEDLVRIFNLAGYEIVQKGE